MVRPAAIRRRISSSQGLRLEIALALAPAPRNAICRAISGCKYTPPFATDRTASANSPGSSFFGDVAPGAGLDGAPRDNRIVVHAEDDDPRLSLALQNSAEKLQSRKPRKVDVDHRDVGFMGEKGGEARLAVLRLKHLHARIRLQKRSAAGNDDRMIVDDKNPQRLTPRMADIRAASSGGRAAKPRQH